MLRQWSARSAKKAFNEAHLPFGQSADSTQESADDPDYAAYESEPRHPPSPQAPAVVQNGARPTRSQTLTQSSYVSDAPEKTAYSETEEILLSDDQPLTDTRYSPTLSTGKDLGGGWEGRYLIGQCCENKGWMRRYEGTHGTDSEPVWIYEYCFGDNFTSEEIDRRKYYFQNLVSLNSRLGDGSDFRIIKPKDVICAVETPACYVITKTLPQGQRLADYLDEESGPVSAYQVRTFFRQLLQTLQYLRTYRVNFPEAYDPNASSQARRSQVDNSELGLPHGALGIDRLWLKFSEVPTASGDLPFFVYVSRFSLWEHLCYQAEEQQTKEDPAKTSYPRREIAQDTQALGSEEKDLVALGHTGFAWITRQQQPGDPTDKSLWPQDKKIRAFYPFVCQLLGHGPRGAFSGVDAAIAALKRVPEAESPDEPVSVSAPIAPLAEEDAAELGWQPSGWIWVWLGLAILGIGGFMIFRLGQKADIIQIAGKCERDAKCLLAKNGGSGNVINYAFEPDHDWHDSFFRTLRSPFEANNNSEPLLEQALEARDDSLKLNRIQQADLRNDWLEQLASPSPADKATLSVGFVRTKQEMPLGVKTQVVAYDGIVVFVAYSDSHREQGIPRLINGKISLKELQDLFLGRTQKLKGHKETVKLYRPNDEQVVEDFHNFLFTGEHAPQDLLETEDTKGLLSQKSHESSDIKAEVLDDFESSTGSEPTIGIGFDLISRVAGQCSVYPLTLTTRSNTFSILVDADGKAIDIDTDLCGDKGAYWVNSDIFKQKEDILNEEEDIAYPLGYGLAIAYPNNCTEASAQHCQAGEILSKKLLSAEGQYLLSETGLVPHMSIREIRQFLWE
ncbi:MAG: hypothetical protein AAFO06_16455 [Cyanobacteria bacterium J06597_16]